MNHIKLEKDGIWIEGSLTRETVSDLRQDLLSVLSGSDTLRMVHLTKVSAVDSAGIQLLSATVKAFPQLRLVAPSDVVCAALARLGAFRLVEGDV